MTTPIVESSEASSKQLATFQANFEKVVSPEHTDDEETDTTQNTENNTFQDWESALCTTAAAKTQAETDSRNAELETDACFQHSDKKRRINPPSRSSSDQAKCSVTVKSSNESRTSNYRRQPGESSTSGSSAKVSSTGPMWGQDSATSDETSQPAVVSTYGGDNESIILTEQVDGWSIANTDKKDDCDNSATSLVEEEPQTLRRHGA